MTSTAAPNARTLSLQLSAVLGALLCLSCGTTPAKPDGLREHFITGKDNRFPPSQYITGVGQGRDISAARLSAFADIGAQMQTRIEGTLVSREQEMTGPGGNTTVSFVTNDVRQHTTFDHRGLATVADTQVEGGTVHAFAVLDRAALAEPFEREVTRTWALLRRALEDFAAAAAKMDLRAAGSLAKEVRRRAPELAAALVLFESSTASAPIGGQWGDVQKAAQIDADFRRLRSKASVAICLTPTPDFPEASQLVSAVTDQVASLGLVALPCAQAGGNTMFRAEGRISAVFSTEPMLGNAVFCRPSVDLRILHVGSGAEILSAPLGGDPARAAGRDREAATRAALKKLAGFCAPKLAEAFGDATK